MQCSFSSFINMSCSQVLETKCKVGHTTTVVTIIYSVFAVAEMHRYCQSSSVSITHLHSRDLSSLMDWTPSANLNIPTPSPRRALCGSLCRLLCSGCSFELPAL